MKRGSRVLAVLLSLLLGVVALVAVPPTAMAAGTTSASNGVLTVEVAADGTVTVTPALPGVTWMQQVKSDSAYFFDWAPDQTTLTTQVTLEPHTMHVTFGMVGEDAEGTEFALMEEATITVGVTPDNQFFTEIEWLAAEGISTGWTTPRGKVFEPRAPINRDAMAAFLYRYAGMTGYEPEAQSFTDVTPTTQFFTEIEWLAAEGITTGWPTADGGREFRPVQPIARDAMAAFLFRFGWMDV